MPHPPRKSEGRRLAILGSTGSIGTQTLEVVRRFPDRFAVDVLTCGRNVDLLVEQAAEFRPTVAVVKEDKDASIARSKLQPLGVEVLSGNGSLVEAVAMESVDVVVAAMVGFAGLAPVLRAAELGKTIALANKEALVVAGELLRTVIERTGAALIPIDSEHSAIFQCLEGESVESVGKLILTASGGPFKDRPLSTFESITREEALAHPNWTMGNKITIDSATMMNKGLELIEAHWLFGLVPSKIDIVVHPQSIIHSMIEFVDGSVKAQLSRPDMRLPIQYALTYPERLDCALGRLNWSEALRLDFEPPDRDKFPCIRLAYEAAKAGGAAPAVLNAANEVAVSLFLEGRISFPSIPSLIEEALASMTRHSCDSLETLRVVDAQTREFVAELNRAAAN